MLLKEGKIVIDGSSSKNVLFQSSFKKWFEAGFEIFEGSPNNAKLLDKFIEKLCNSRKVRMGDFMMCDRGFTSMKNYHILISRFVLVPMIFARKNTDVKRIISTLTPQISIWNGKKYLLNIWKKIVKELAEILEIWPVLRELAGM